jgi:hypothetical protein
MIPVCPRSRPRQTRQETERILQEKETVELVAILAMRPYYRDTMGKPGKNDIGIYDDAAFLISPRFYMPFNWNTDPSRNFTVDKPIGMATLVPGKWYYKVGIHGLSRPVSQRYTALVQAEPFTVARYQGEGKAPLMDRGFFGINCHKGGYNGTSSAGCQTCWPDQYPDFINCVINEITHYRQELIPYVLIDN